MRFVFPLCAASLVAIVAAAGCGRDVRGLDAKQIEERYGVSGAHSETIDTTDGPLEGTLVPITLADGSTGQLFIPRKAASAPEAVYVMDQQGLHPVRLGEHANRSDLSRAPGIVERRPAAPRPKGRSWEKEVLIIGGSAGAGTAIGALAGGKKGAGVGAAAGGVGGLIYDLATRNK